MDEKFLKSSILEAILEGVSGDIRALVGETLSQYARGDESRTSLETTSQKLRYLYFTLSHYLLETRAQQLNQFQKLFINTGILAENVTLTVNGKELQVELLPEGLISQLIEAYTQPRDSKDLNSPVLSTYRRWEAIARETLQPLSEGRAKKKVKARAKRFQTAKRESDNLLKFRSQAGQLLHQAEDAYQELLDALADPKLHTLSKELLFVRHYIQKLQDNPKEALLFLRRRSTQITSYLENIQKLQSCAAEASKVFLDLDKALDHLISSHLALASEDLQLQEEAGQVFFHAEALKNIKHDNEALTPFLVKGAQSSPQKIPFGDARILLKDVLNLEKDHLLTPQIVELSLKKLTDLHTNLFPRDAAGEPILPPICIEPIYDYAEWFEDRLVLSFVAPPILRKGPKITLSPVDLLLLRGFGLILAKDPIFDYRGEINVDTFMGDYAGKVEKKAKVKWTGAKKKATMVMTSKMIDEASREEAVRDYIDFIYCMINGFPPPPRISHRKLSIFFKYVILKDIEFSAQLLLEHIGIVDPLSARQTLLHYTRKVTREAILLAQSAFQKSPLLQKQFQNNDTLLLQKIFGKVTIQNY